MNFKENLKNLRTKQNLSRKELANKLNILQTAVRDWEQGLRQPRNLETLEQLTEILECDYNQLLK